MLTSLIYTFCRALFFVLRDSAPPELYPSRPPLPQPQSFAVGGRHTENKGEMFCHPAPFFPTRGGARPPICSRSVERRGGLSSVPLSSTRSSISAELLRTGPCSAVSRSSVSS